MLLREKAPARTALERQGRSILMKLELSKRGHGSECKARGRLGPLNLRCFYANNFDQEGQLSLD